MQLLCVDSLRDTHGEITFLREPLNGRRRKEKEQEGVNRERLFTLEYQAECYVKRKR